ncbi:hypothetical protein [Rhodovulum sulfidophilum]|uniref:hypothetical protein n=1 Tax=Rhodovulum sulfidophilum TaxID=35806 RepID=UPI0019219846|nr:hypothetical protein [Rhodovulum sulfidophilum]MBL3561640.1 hypothetical protein [Rhodovulum sulfidophilum]
MFRYVLAAVAGLMTAPGLQAQEVAQQTVSAEMPPQCAVVDNSRIVSVVVCEGPREEAAFAEAGRAACGVRRPCGAWFWPSREAARKRRPPTMTG